MSDVSRSAASGSCTIVDAPWSQRIATFVIIAVLLGIACAIFIAPFDTKGPIRIENIIGCFIFGCIPTALAVWLFSIHKSRLKGYIIDVKNDILEFPKGFRAKRHQVRLSGIREINIYDENVVYTDRHGKVQTGKDKKLDISGDFGAHSLYFASDDKRNQVYSTIARINKMN